MKTVTDTGKPLANTKAETWIHLYRQMVRIRLFEEHVN